MTRNKRTRISAQFVLENVMRIDRRGIGPIYRGVISISDLYDLLRNSYIRYSPRYQRGFKLGAEDIEDEIYNDLLPLNDPRLQIDQKRAQAMAVKFLQNRLYTTTIVWNARREEDGAEPVFDEKHNVLRISTTITVPDTAHRHQAYYTLALWNENPSKIPTTVTVDGVPIDRETIEEIMAGEHPDYEAFDPEEEFIYVDVYNLSAEEEGYLYDEFNADLRAPSSSTQLDLNPTKTPSRRLVHRLMQSSAIFGRDEIEVRRNTIGSKSRKLTTIATLEASVRPFTKRLTQIENTPAYEDLVAFLDALFQAWAQKFPAWDPSASAEDRLQLRRESFALSNVILHPFFRLAFDLWERARKRGGWQSDGTWRTAIERLANGIATRDSKGNPWTGDVMSRANPDWIGKILVDSGTRDSNGDPIFGISSTRQTRESAYQYLYNIAGLSDED